MAKEMSYVVPENGATLPESYWYPAFVSFDLLQRAAIITFLCFANKQAKLDGLQPLARKSVSLLGDEYNTILSTVLSTVGVTQDGLPCEEQLFNILGFGIMQSVDAQAFFTGATDVE